MFSPEDSSIPVQVHNEEILSDTCGAHSETPETDQEIIKDYLFDQYMKQKLLEDFFEAMEEYVERDDVDKMREELAKHDDAEVYATLSLPYELRKRKFLEFKTKIEGDGMTPPDLINELLQVSKKYQFGVGYHTSPMNIQPSADGSWQIKGTEIDHRDNDLKMAYYSTKYRHLFKKKNPGYVYIVRTEPRTHKTDGVWSRAGSLSVVACVPFRDVVDYVERTTTELIEDEKAAGTK